MNLTVLAYVLISLPLIFYLYVRWAHSFWKRNGIQSLDPTFFYGHVEKFVKKQLSMGDQFQILYNKMKSNGWRYGGIYFLTMPSFVPTDLDLIKNMLQSDFLNFMNHGVYVNEEADPLTGNLFNLEDARWRSVRVKLTPTFTSGKLKMMFQTMVACTDGLEDLLLETQKQHGVIEIKDVLARFTTDVIGSVGFGIECSSLKNPNSEFRQYGRRVFEGITFLRRMKALVSFVAPKPFLKWINFKQTDPEIERFFLTLVKDTIRYRERNNISRKDFMHLLLQLKNRGTVAEDDRMTENGSEIKDTFLTENQIAAQCFVFFVAGFETSATTMLFALYELAENQDIQEKLRKHNNEVLERYSKETSYEAIMEMAYLDKVILETLRKHSPIAGLPRVCTKDYPIPGTNVVLKKGTRIHIPIHAIHRDPDYYPDPEKFDPERFSEENKSNRHQFAFLPFGEGPRICIGARFGILQAKVGLLSIIRRFKVTLNNKTLTPLQHQTNLFVTAPKGGIWLNVQEINR